MRNYLVCAMSVVFCCVVAVGGTAWSADTIMVPKTLADVSDEGLKKALEEYAPAYDEMGRGSQVFAYAHVYKWQKGEQPNLDADDAQLLKTDAAVPVQQYPSEWLDVESVYLSAPAQPVNIIIRDVDWFDNPVLDADK